LAAQSAKVVVVVVVVLVVLVLVVLVVVLVEVVVQSAFTPNTQLIKEPGAPGRQVGR
jgi:hypothetical protein